MTRHLAVAEPASKIEAVITLAAQGVHITGRGGQVDRRQVPLSKSNNEEVTWFAYGSESATIVFSSPSGSPFQSLIFQVPAGGSISSGAIRSDAAYQPYKYTVVGSAGANDPEVIIDK